MAQEAEREGAEQGQDTQQEQAKTPRTGIDARGVRFEVSGHTILHDVDVRIEPGQFIGILGPSGSGKSTLLMALTGLRPITAGAIRYDGRALAEHYDALKGDIGFVPQDDIVPTALRVRRVLEYAADLRLPDLAPEERKRRVLEVLAMLDLKERESVRVSRLSGGQRKRVSVGVELLSRPQALFADEPTSGLDPALERKLMEALRQLASGDRMVILTTHVVNSLDLLDRICVLVAGRRVFWGTSAQLKQFFQIEDIVQMYSKLAEREPDAWKRDFEQWRRGQAGGA